MNGMYVSCQPSAAQHVHLQHCFGCLLSCGGFECPLGSGRDSMGSAVPHAWTPLCQSALSLPSQGQTELDGMLPPGMASWVHSCIHSHAHRLPELSLRRWGHASHFLACGRNGVSLAASLPRRSEKAGERVQPVLLEPQTAPVAPGATSPLGATHPAVLRLPSRTSCRVIESESVPICFICFAILGNFEKQRPICPHIGPQHPRPTPQDFAQRWESRGGQGGDTALCI